MQKVTSATMSIVGDSKKQSILQHRKSVEMVMQSEFIFIDNYQNEWDSNEWSKLLREEKFAFQQDRELYQQIKMKVFAGLGNLTKQGQRDAWLLILGINTKSEFYKTHLELFTDMMKQ